MLLALLLLAWMWDRVLTSCGGGPETMGKYRLQATTWLTSPNGNCWDDQGLLYLCPVTIPGPWVPFGPEIPDPGSGSQVASPIDPVGDPALLPTPPVGGLSAWPWSFPVVATDLAGNSGPCP